MCASVRWSMRLHSPCVLIIAILLIVLGCRPTVAGGECRCVFKDSADISGMVAMPGNTPEQQRFLVVRDYKDKDGQREKSRVGVLTITNNQAGSVVAVHIPATEWCCSRPNDLEAVCVVPDKPDTYLLMESSYRKKIQYGRVFMVEIKQDGSSYSGKLIGVFQLPEKEKKYSLEAMVSFKWKAIPYVLFGDRGEYAANTVSEKGCKTDVTKSHGATLFLAKLPKPPCATIQWQRLVRNPLVAPTFEGESGDKYRHCSSLYLRSTESLPGNKRQVWASADFDCGDNCQWRSVVYLAGVLNLEAASTDELFVPSSNPKAVWSCDNIKIEALAQTAGDKPTLCFGTDDEKKRGKWGLLTGPQ